MKLATTRLRDNLYAREVDMACVKITARAPALSFYRMSFACVHRIPDRVAMAITMARSAFDVRKFVILGAMALDDRLKLLYG